MAIAPVVIRGTPQLIYEDGPWLSPRAHITVMVQEPLSPESLGADAEALAASTREKYRAWLSEPLR